MGEQKNLDFTFDTYAGKVFLESTDETMTPYGGAVPWAAFLKKCPIFEHMQKTCPVIRKSNNATSVYDIINSFALTVLCDGKRFNHVQRLKHDKALPEIFGMKKICSDDTIRRFFKSFGSKQGKEWVEDASKPVWSALPEKFILDWDSTVQTRFGKQEEVEVGYNPTKKGRPSHHPLLATVAGTRLCAYYRLRPGNSHTAAQWEDAMEEVLNSLGQKHRPWLNRGDIGFGSEKICAWHDERNDVPHYLFKLKMSNNVKRAMWQIPEDQWLGKSEHGVLQVASAWVKLPSWTQERRVVFGRRLQGETNASEANAFWDIVKHEYEAYVTDLDESEADVWQIVELYRKRADAENVFDEIKNQWGFNGFCCHDKTATELAARILLLTYNLWNLFCRFLEPSRHVEAIVGRRWFLLMAARLVKSGGKNVVKVSVVDEWRRVLSDGYKRICKWLDSTAAQLSVYRRLEHIPSS